MEIKEGFYITKHDDTLFLTEIVKNGSSYYGTDLRKLNNGEQDLMNYWPVYIGSNAVKFLIYEETLKSLEKKYPQYFV